MILFSFNSILLTTNTPLVFTAELIFITVDCIDGITAHLILALRLTVNLTITLPSGRETLSTGAGKLITLGTVLRITVRRLVAAVLAVKHFVTKPLTSNATSITGAFELLGSVTLTVELIFASEAVGDAVTTTGDGDAVCRVIVRCPALHLIGQTAVQVTVQFIVAFRTVHCLIADLMR